jgi:hypothetical protein
MEEERVFAVVPAVLFSMVCPAKRENDSAGFGTEEEKTRRESKNQ